ncbi:MAG: protein-glutamate O-methyltransferase CheR [Bacillota bacterium]
MHQGAQLSDEEFELIRSLVYQRFGINLGDHKRSLVIGRLQKVLLSGGFNSFKEYYQHVVQDISGRALLTLVDRISTNHTYFFREQEHFDFLKTVVLPEIAAGIKGGQKKNLRFWCAGCASGEEPYSVAMVISDFFDDNLSGIDVGILATDISVSALEKAVQGVYPTEQLAGVPPLYRQRYFDPLGKGNWAVKEELKRMVLFRRLNLMRSEYPFKGRFQVIFCRNVMIYFDNPTKKAVVERLYRYTEPGGYLFIGHSETLDQSAGLYRYVRPAVYQKV